MTKEDKKLLIQDLCARLPYEPIVRCYFINGGGEEVLDTDDIADLLYNDEDSEFPMYKPYLRPMSSMTDKEKKIQKTYIYHFSGNNLPNYEGNFVFENEVHEYIDWLNANHFDYRGLIPMGLALEAPENMYTL